MDQGGLMNGSKRDERLNTLGYGNSGIQSAMSVAPTSMVPQGSPLMQPVSGDLPNGVSSSPTLEEHTTSVSSTLGFFAEDSEFKIIGRDQRSQQHQPLGSFTLGDNFSGLEASIADLNSTSLSMDSLIGGVDPNLFPLKSEDLSPMDKCDMDLDQDSFGPIGKDVDIGNHKLFSDNTLDLLQDFELEGSPSDFYVGDDAFLSNIGEDTLLDLPTSSERDLKPVASTNSTVNGAASSGANTVNATSTFTVKASRHSTPISICGITTSSGQSFLFGTGSSSGAVNQQREQKPIINVYTPLTSSEGGWNRGQGFGNASGLQPRASESFSTTTYAR
ncbi:Glucocorticoid receptor [Triplophysa tibetana]|uniref:Glucocorticoid receptor n=1 Tax=Triplophysa tibetana TaxID=1572043 RepID=A0A5A9NJY4_9TELE|nr:Glucocorticoid receptor [Triplophysa tibetana]